MMKYEDTGIAIAIELPKAGSVGTAGVTSLCLVLVPKLLILAGDGVLG